MVIELRHDLERSRWSKATARWIDVICFVALVAVIGTVIYGFVLRAIWAHGYYIPVVVAILGAATLMIGLAQQAIAARDAATWRDMAVWQLRAAREKVLAGTTVPHAGTEPLPDPDSPDYYEHLVEVMLESLQRTDEEQATR